MTDKHLSMAELLAVRAGDRSEPSFAMARLHVESCAQCAGEIDRLHQRVARLRALPALAPSVDVFPAVRRSLRQVRIQRYWHYAASCGVAAAAALVVWIVGHNLASPPALSAEAEIAQVKSASAHTQERIVEWSPRQRALDGGTVIVVLELEDRIADVEKQLGQIETTDAVESRADSRQLGHELQLWRERDGLLNALLTIHVNRSVKIGL